MVACRSQTCFGNSLSHGSAAPGEDHCPDRNPGATARPPSPARGEIRRTVSCLAVSTVLRVTVHALVAFNSNFA